MKNGSGLEATASSSGASGSSMNRSCSQAKNLMNDRPEKSASPFPSQPSARPIFHRQDPLGRIKDNQRRTKASSRAGQLCWVPLVFGTGEWHERGRMAGKYRSDADA